MAVEMLSNLVARLKITPEAARSLAKRLRLPRSRSNDGKALVSVDLAEVQHTPLPGRSPAGHEAGAAALKVRVGELQEQLAKLEAVAGGHRADFERERHRVNHLMAELLKATADTMTAKEAIARLEGELSALRAKLSALRARPWWRRLLR